MTHRLAIIVVNFGSSELLANNLVETAAGIADAEVFVVDNWTDQAERHRVASLAAKQAWHLVAMGANAGFGGGVNAGARYAFDGGATDILVINPDARIDAPSVRALAESTVQNRMAVSSPVVRDPGGRVWFAGLDLYLADGTVRAPRRRREYPGAKRIEWLSGACLWITREIWSATGGFDDEYFLYWEDIDFSHRVTAAGGILQVVPEATAIHDEGGTHRGSEQRPEAKSQIYYFYNIRNRMLYAAKHLGPTEIRHWKRTAPRNAWQILLRGGRRQFLRPAAPLGAAWRGLRDGRRIARAVLSQGTRIRDTHAGTPDES